MPRSLLPPRGIFVPASILYDKSISPAVRDTWVQLRGLAWGQLETPSLSFMQLVDILDKSQSTLYGHMTILRARGALLWRSARDGTFIVSFPEDEEIIQYSRKLELNDQQLNPSELADESKALEDQELKTKLESEVKTVGDSFQKIGKLEGKEKPKRKKSTADERTNHPAIQAVFGILGRFPAKHEYDALIEAVGDKPDKPKLRLCWAEWRRPRQGFPNGYSPRNYGWVMDWYVNGLPDSKNGAKPESALDRIARRIENGEEI